MKEPKFKTIRREFETCDNLDQLSSFKAKFEGKEFEIVNKSGVEIDQAPLCRGAVIEAIVSKRRLRGFGRKLVITQILKIIPNPQLDLEDFLNAN